MENSFKSVIEQSNSVLILVPSKPYFDQVAAALSLYLSLKNTKDASIVCPSPTTVEFNRLVGVNKISSELGNKNLIIRFSDYEANDIERVSYDIEDRQFRLSVIPKPGVSAPQKGQVGLSYSGVSADTVILIGGANESHFPALGTKDLGGAKVVHIGVKELSIDPKRQLMSFAKPSSSVSEIMAGMIKEGGFVLDADVATNLLMGIEEGSNKFSSSYSTAYTFQLMSELMQAGGRRQGTPSVQAGDFPQGSIPGQIPQQNQKVQEIKEPEKKEKAPKDWLEPKIYKGTSIK